MNIPFNLPPFVGEEPHRVAEAFAARKTCGDGGFTRRCNDWLAANIGVRKALLTTCCTHALEMAALLLDIAPGDEVVMPSYTFVSTANAFALRGATIKFIDIRPDTLNMDETKVEAALTSRTKAIVPVHYAGVGCAMDEICALAKQRNIAVAEDAAQGVMAAYKGRPLGGIGEIGCFSFHETKNYSMGEGGALLLRDEIYTERAEILREKGTNRSRFLRGQVDKYTWVDVGSSYLPSDILAAALSVQLDAAEAINQNRLASWDRYHSGFADLERRERACRPTIPPECTHNAHMYYLKCRDLAERTALIAHLKTRGIGAVFHYVPLHTSEAGRKFGEFVGEDRYTTRESERIVRLPMYYGLQPVEIDTVIAAVCDFYA